MIGHGVTKFGAPTGLTTLVLDMGGGTFDWFVSKGAVPNHQRCGAATRSKPLASEWLWRLMPLQFLCGRTKT